MLVFNESSNKNEWSDQSVLSYSQTVVEKNTVDNNNKKKQKNLTKSNISFLKSQGFKLK